MVSMRDLLGEGRLSSTGEGARVSSSRSEDKRSGERGLGDGVVAEGREDLGGGAFSLSTRSA